ncbi:hypothetical protein WG902_18270 [Ramlibacter sp. PS3R-8]|uniref:hypothetical protein n=1 Tax=Ramlibacter sp. PS3R-8 TaxID=3133437 RepID=UPI00309D345A
MTLDDSLNEADIARRNRQAAICVYVHSERTAHDSIPRLQRFGCDIITRWNPEDQASDLWVKAAVMVAKAMSVRAAQKSSGEAASLDKMDRAIQALGKQIGHFEEIATWANSSSSATGKIVKKVDAMKVELEERLVTLNDELDKLKSAV